MVLLIHCFSLMSLIAVGTFFAKETVINRKMLHKQAVIRIVIRAFLGCSALILMQPVCAWSTDEGIVSEYDVKAAFLLNFVKFVSWPETNRKEELILCIAGEERFGDALSLIRGAQIKDRTIVISTAPDGDSLTGCDVLFIASSEKDRLPSLLSTVKGLPVLTVSEIDGFAERGGMINFIVVENKIRFEINPEAAKQAGITISSQLLQLARIIKQQ